MIFISSPHLIINLHLPLQMLAIRLCDSTVYQCYYNGCNNICMRSYDCELYETQLHTHTFDVWSQPGRVCLVSLAQQRRGSVRSGVIQPSGAKSTERVNGGRRDEKKRAGILSCTLRAVMQCVFFFFHGTSFLALSVLPFNSQPLAVMLYLLQRICCSQPLPALSFP